MRVEATPKAPVVRISASSRCGSTADVLAVPRQVEDRVADELSGRVVGRLAAAVGLDDLDIGAVGHVHLARLGAPAERDRRWMLEEEHRVRAAPSGRPRRPAL